VALRPRVFEVQPRVGIGPFLLGMTPAEVRRAARRCTVTVGDGNEERVDALGLKVDYQAGAVAFVEAFAVARVRVTLFGRDMFATPADELVAVVVRHARLRPGRFPPGRDDYLFPALRLALWRAFVPDEPTAPGERGWAFESVSVHAAGYYEA
jgi:hypothetical protein